MFEDVDIGDLQRFVEAAKKGRQKMVGRAPIATPKFEAEVSAGEEAVDRAIGIAIEEACVGLWEEAIRPAALRILERHQDDATVELKRRCQAILGRKD